MKSEKFQISSNDKKIITSILAKVREGKRNKTEVMSFSDLYSILNKEEKEIIKKFIKINPRIYGFKGEYFGLQRVPKNLIAIRNQKYKSKKKIEKISVQYLPEFIYSEYKKLSMALFKDTKRKLLIDSGYRSPAYQIITFLWYLKFHKFDFRKTVKRVAIPGYSEHGYSKKQAVDFLTSDGVPTDERPLEFSKTVEYKWLLKNANKFGFYQSYPRSNKDGMMFEPWHWRYSK